MPKYTVKLSIEEREMLLGMLKKGRTSAKKLGYARILLAVDESEEALKKGSYERLAKELHTSSKTIERVCKRLVEEGLEAALNRRLHSRTKPRKIQGEEEAHLIALACSQPPQGRCRWTLKLLAGELVRLEIVDHVSASTVGRALKKTN
jgi:transposase